MLLFYLIFQITSELSGGTTYHWKKIIPFVSPFKLVIYLEDFDSPFQNWLMTERYEEPSKLLNEIFMGFLIQRPTGSVFFA